MDPFQWGYEKLVSFELYIQQEMKQNEVIGRLVCGGLSGIAAKTAIAPAERIKMTFQVSSEKFTYKKAFARASDIVRNQGVISLWKGHSTTILRIAPYAGLSYAIHDGAEHGFKQMLKTEKLPYAYKFLAGSLAGLGGTLLTYPLDVLRVRLAIDANWKNALKQGGMFQGLVPTLLGIVPYSGTVWGAKQSMLEFFPTFVDNTRGPTMVESLIINAVAGLCGQFVTYPLDVVRRRMQVAKAIDGPNNKLMSFREVFRHLSTTEGWRGLSKGFSLNIIKGPISLSISFTTYDMLRNYYSNNSGSSSGSRHE